MGLAASGWAEQAQLAGLWKNTAVGIAQSAVIISQLTANPRSRGLHKKSVGQLVKLFVGEESQNLQALRKVS